MGRAAAAGIRALAAEARPTPSPIISARPTWPSRNTWRHGTASMPPNAGGPMRPSGVGDADSGGLK